MRGPSFGVVLAAASSLIPVTYARCDSNATSYDFV